MNKIKASFLKAALVSMLMVVSAGIASALTTIDNFEATPGRDPRGMMDWYFSSGAGAGEVTIPNPANDTTYYVDGVRSMKIQYPGATGSQWGGYWGGGFSNPSVDAKDVTGDNMLVYSVKGDGTSNTLRLGFDEYKNGTQDESFRAIDVMPLSTSASFKEVKIPLSRIWRDEYSANKDDDTFSNKIKTFVYVYSGTNQTSAFHYVDAVKSVSWTGPTVNMIGPNYGSANTSVTLVGSGFGATKGSSTVTFNGVTASTTSWSDTRIVATVPSGAATGQVQVNVGSNASNGVTFLVGATGASITGATLATPTTITITGSGFGANPGAQNKATAANHIVIGSIRIADADVVSWSDTSITINKPANLPNGTYDVQVRASDKETNVYQLAIKPPHYEGGILGLVSINSTGGIWWTVSNPSQGGAGATDQVNIYAPQGQPNWSGDIGTALPIPWQVGDDHMVKFDGHDSQYITVPGIFTGQYSRGYYAVTNKDITAAGQMYGTIDQYNNAQLRPIPTPTATVNGQNVNLSWAAAVEDNGNPTRTNIVSYKVHRIAAPSGYQTTTIATNVPHVANQQITFTDTNAPQGVPIAYSVSINYRAGVSAHNSSYSVPVTIPDTTGPVIIHTPITSPQPAGVAVAINAEITDNVAVTGARVYYKQSGSPTFTMVNMTNTSGNSWTANIPANIIQQPGVYYYIWATDAANNTATHPATNAATAPHYFTVSGSTTPVVVSVFPSNGSTNVPLRASIGGTFSVPMNQTSVNNAFTISPAVAGDIVWNGNTFVFTPSQGLAQNTVYTCSFSTAAQSAAGLSLQSTYTWSFTTGNGSTDNTAPYVIAVNPVNNATGVDINNPSIAVTFSEAMKRQDSEWAFWISNSVAGTFSWAGNTMLFRPNSALVNNTVYQLSEGTGAKDLAGNSMAAAYNWQFTTATGTNPNGPKVIASSPYGSNVYINSRITATFSEAMNTATVNSSTFTVSPAVAGSFSWAGNKVTFTPNSNLAINTLYTVTITTGVQNQAGNNMASSYVWKFTTNDYIMIDPYEGTEGIIYYEGEDITANDHGYDLVNKHDGAQGEWVKYSYSGNTWGGYWGGVLPVNLDISQANGVSFWLRGDGSNNTIRMDLVESTAGGADGETWMGPEVYLNYTGWKEIRIPYSVFNRSPFGVQGNGVFNKNINNYTAVYIGTNTSSANHYVDTYIAGTFNYSNYPSVTAVSPLHRATNVAPSTTIQVTFSKAMNQASAQAAFKIVPSVTGTFSWNAGSTVMTFTPSSALAANTQYDVTISTYAADTTNNNLISPYSWYFTTGTGNVNPTILSVFPPNGSTNVPLQASIGATFSMPMNQTSVNNAFSISPSIPGVFSWTGNTFAFTPSVPLAANTTYTVTIANTATGTNGLPLLNTYTWSFTSGNGTNDTTAPYIVGVTPPNNATNVALRPTVGVSFSEAMNQSSAQNAFQMTVSGSPTPIAGTFSWNGNTLVFNPTAALTANTIYTLRVSTGAQDLAGNPMAAIYNWQFTTGPSTDTTPPTVIASTPFGGNVSTTAQISATFSELMNQSTVNSASFTVSPAPTATPTFTWTGNKVVYNYTGSLAQNTTYTVTISTAVADSSNNNMASSYVWSFRTGTNVVSQPSDVHGRSMAKTGNDLRLTWDPATGPAAIAYYEIYRGTTPNFTPGAANLLTTVPGTTYTDPGALTAASSYYYSVYAVDVNGGKSANKSNTGFKLNKDMTYHTAISNINWIAIPALSPYTNAAAIAADIPNATKVSRFNPDTQLYENWENMFGTWVGTNFNVRQGESYAVMISANSAGRIVGWNDPYTVNMTFHTNISNINWVSIPFTGLYADADSIAKDIPNATKVSRFNPNTQLYENWENFFGTWTGTNFTFAPGEGYAAIINANSAWAPKAGK